MRSAYVLLGLVQLTSLQFSSAVCSNGVPGVQDGDICCEAQCGGCGGPGCQLLPGGLLSCCSSLVRIRGVMCSTTNTAPCIIDTDPVCSNGVPGVEADNVCCKAECRTCGGVGCSQRPGGEDACCTSNIEESGKSCSTTSEAPCIIDVCSNGVPGVEADNICCEARCGTCGGVGCSQRPGGEDACCTSNIEDSGVSCSSTSEAPCIIDEGVCSNGVPGVQDDNICCEARCGTCGGSGCSQRPGGEDACCTSNVKDSGILCSTTSEAPCIIDVCSNGVSGVQADDICCEGQCGTCGGPGCSQRPGGEDACCTSNIRDDGRVCSTSSEAPCIIDAVIEQI